MEWGRERESSIGAAQHAGCCHDGRQKGGLRELRHGCLASTSTRPRCLCAKRHSSAGQFSDIPWWCRGLWDMVLHLLIRKARLAREESKKK